MQAGLLKLQSKDALVAELNNLKQEMRAAHRRLQSTEGLVAQR
jgi:hypothetical protein